MRPLDEQEKILAFNLAFICEDIEVIHWLATLTPSIKIKLQDEYKKYREPWENLIGFQGVVNWLLDENGDIVEDDVKNALEYASLSISSSGADHEIAIVELILSECKGQQKEDFVQSQIDSAAISSEDCNIVLSKLLSECKDTLDKWKRIIHLQYEKLFREAIKRGYICLVQYLVQIYPSEKLLPKADDGGKTVLHYAAEWEADNECRKYSDYYLDTVFKSLVKIYKDETVRQVDKQGRTVLHHASFHRSGNFCKFLVDTYWLGNEVDKLGQNVLHYAAQGKRVFGIMQALKEKIVTFDLIRSRNKKGETPLHLTAMCGNENMIYLLGQWYYRREKVTLLRKLLKQTDYLGLTPLHLATRYNHLETVEGLLSAGSNLLEERDISGKIALHSFVENTSLNPEDAKKLIDTLLNHFETDGEKALFLWASAIGIGTVDEMEGINPDHQKILRERKNFYERINFLQEAAQQGNSSLTWELLKGGADFTKISNN